MHVQGDGSKIIPCNWEKDLLERFVAILDYIIRIFLLNDCNEIKTHNQLIC